ncbi:MAG: histidine kinase [Leeuwenhoekiella sp.]
MKILKEKVAGISGKEVVGLILFYLFFSYLYNFVLWYSQYGFENEDVFGFTNFRDFWYRSGMQYAFFIPASVLIWYLGIYLLRNKSRVIQIAVVAILAPIVIYFLRELRYVLVDFLEMSRLAGPAAIWDWYIPLLFFYIQFGCVFAYRYFLENQRKLKVEGALRQAALKSELAAIKAQLNPHFLYNVFNTINASLPPENERTRQMIAELADLFRYQLKATKKDLVPLREELDFVKKYLDLEKARFEERLQVDFEVPKELLTEKVPPMLLQPLVENSVKHGLSSMIEGGRISIKIFKEGEKLKFEIADTGVGVKDKSRLFDTGVGLKNTQLRLQKMYDSTIEIIDNEPKGLLVKFSL